MYKDFSVLLKELDGSNALSDVTNPESTVPMSKVICDSLVAVYQDEPNLSGENKVKRFKLAMKVQGDETDYTVDELATIKELVAKFCTVLAVGQIYEYIDAADTNRTKI